MTDGPTIPTPPGGSKSLVDRVRDIIVSPKTEWDVIDNEPATIAGIYTSYVMILAAIPAVFSALGFLFLRPAYIDAVAQLGAAFGAPVLSTGSIILGCVIQYVVGLVMVYVMALIIDGLAPSFGGTKDQLKAFKLAAYYPTVLWLCGILSLLAMRMPGLVAIVALVALIYALYTLYLGLPKLMKVPQDKAVGYFVVLVVVVIVVYVIVGYIQNQIIYGGFL